MKIEWLKLLKFAMQEWSINPSEFWQLTMVEFIAITKEERPLISREQLEKLKERYND